MTNEPVCGNDTGLPDIAALHSKALYLSGLMAVLSDFDPHDRRTSNGAAAVVFAAEGLAEDIARDMEALMEARP